MEIKDRISFLKKHENDCYRICYYLLQSEKMACEAAKKSIVQLEQMRLILCREYSSRT